jgi:hypothetical protein
VLSLILVLLLVWFVLTVLLAAWTLWFQGYIYSQPVGEMYWRAPAAGTALFLFLCLWAALDYRAPGRYRTLFEFSGREDRKPYEELRIPGQGGSEDLYKLKPSARGHAYHKDKSDKPLPSRPDKIIVVEGDRHYVFEPERDADGHFKEERGQLHYRDKQSGLEMVEGQLGQVSLYHTGWLVVDLLLNLVHLALWWVCLWLLLRFQWSHALGMAVVFWAVMTLCVVPMVLHCADEAAEPRAAARAERFPRVAPTLFSQHGRLARTTMQGVDSFL